MYKLVVSIFRRFYLTNRDLGNHQTITNTLSAKFKALWISQSKEPYLPQYLHRLCNSYVKGEDPRRFIPVKVWLYMHLFQKCTCYCRKMLAKFWHDVFYLLNRAAVDWTVSCSGGFEPGAPVGVPAWQSSILTTRPPRDNFCQEIQFKYLISETRTLYRRFSALRPIISIYLCTHHKVSQPHSQVPLERG